MQTESKQPHSKHSVLQRGRQILKRRKEIEQELVDMLKETDPPSSANRRTSERARSDFTLEDIKDLIYNEKDNNDLHKLIAIFDRGGDASELSNVLELVTDAWNYFPHKPPHQKSLVWG